MVVQCICKCCNNMILLILYNIITEYNIGILVDWEYRYLLYSLQVTSQLKLSCLVGH